MDILLSPPVAFLIYIPLVFLISLLGRSLAGTNKSSSLKTSIYGSGEAAPTNLAAPGYRPFFRIALFFAVLHLGILVLGTGGSKRNYGHIPGGSGFRFNRVNVRIMNMENQLDKKWQDTLEGIKNWARINSPWAVHFQ